MTKVLKLLVLSLALGLAVCANIHTKPVVTTYINLGPIPGIQIPADTLKTKFGPGHPFWLKSHGIDPVFDFGGYRFKAVTLGRELYDPLYYDVKVYVNLDEEYKTNDYRLYTTKEKGVSVSLAILGKL